MPTLAVTNFNIVVSVVGGWVSLFGLVSYLCKENFYLSEACKYPRFPQPIPMETCADQHFRAYSDIALGRGGILSPCSQFHSAS